MKEAELKLVSELMKNCRRSDRELAKAVGVSQPTVSRMISRLEKEGIIREYTIVPDFSKLGYEIMSISFLRPKRSRTPEEVEEIRRIGAKRLEEFSEVIMSARGTGIGFASTIISIHKDYSSYQQHLDRMEKYTNLIDSSVQSFVISLSDKVKYRPLTLSTFGKHLIAEKKGISHE